MHKIGLDMRNAYLRLTDTTRSENDAIQLTRWMLFCRHQLKIVISFFGFFDISRFLQFSDEIIESSWQIPSHGRNVELI